MVFSVMLLLKMPLKSFNTCRSLLYSFSTSQIFLTRQEVIFGWSRTMLVKLHIWDSAGGSSICWRIKRKIGHHCEPSQKNNQFLGKLSLSFTDFVRLDVSRCEVFVMSFDRTFHRMKKKSWYKQNVTHRNKLRHFVNVKVFQFFTVKSQIDFLCMKLKLFEMNFSIEFTYLIVNFVIDEQLMLSCLMKKLHFKPINFQLILFSHKTSVNYQLFCS